MIWWQALIVAAGGVLGWRVPGQDDLEQCVLEVDADLSDSQPGYFEATVVDLGNSIPAMRTLAQTYLINSLAGGATNPSLNQSMATDNSLDRKGTTNLDLNRSLAPVAEEQSLVTEPAQLFGACVTGWCKGDVSEMYDVGEELGSGSAGQVFKVRKRTNGKEYAMKRITKREFNDVEIDVLLQGFPYNYRIYSAFVAQDGSAAYLIMPLATYGAGSNLDLPQHITLSARDKENGNADKFKLLLAYVAYGLWNLHNGGYVHCDLKGNNLLGIKPQDYRELLLFLTDFGLARRWPVERPHAHILGTPPYIDPDRALGWPFGPETDWFSFLLMVYQLVTGEYLEGFSPRDFASVRSKQPGGADWNNLFMRKKKFLANGLREKLLAHPELSWEAKNLSKKQKSDRENLGDLFLRNLQNLRTKQDKYSVFVDKTQRPWNPPLEEHPVLSNPWFWSYRDDIPQDRREAGKFWGEVGKMWQQVMVEEPALCSESGCARYRELPEFSR